MLDANKYFDLNNDFFERVLIVEYSPFVLLVLNVEGPQLAFSKQIIWKFQEVLTFRISYWTVEQYVLVYIRTLAW